MHDPAERARHLAETGFADAYVEAFHTIFGIDISSGARTGGGPAESGSVAGEPADGAPAAGAPLEGRSEEHTSELQSRGQLVCRLLLQKKNQTAGQPDSCCTV